MRITNEVYEAARGRRSGWELDWPAATASRWNDPYSRARVTNETPTSSCSFTPGRPSSAS